MRILLRVILITFLIGFVVDLLGAAYRLSVAAATLQQSYTFIKEKS